MANLKSLKELLLDEQKLLTYVSVSKELCVHVNESKTLLNQLVKEIKEKQPEITLNVNFIVSGLLNDNSARTLVCSEADLDSERTKFRVVFFQHIYSISQGLSGVDNAAIVSVNRFADYPLCTGLIKSNTCIKRTTDEMGALKHKSQVAIESQVVTAPLKREKTKDVIPNVADTKSVTKPQSSKSEPSIKSEIISPKKSSSSASNGKINATNGKKNNKSIAGFFSKGNSGPTKSAKPTQDNEQKKKKDTEIQDMKKIEVKTEEMDIDVEVPVKKLKTEPVSATKDTSKKNSLSKIKKTAKVDKKRKRVLHVSDSESDEDPFADNKPDLQESDDEIPPTPSVNTVKITSGILNPKKRRKMVDKTYTDEDGYILTRKEEVYESCSEDEEVKPLDVVVEKENVEKANKIKTEVSPPKEKKAKTSKKKISPPQKGKQATMMNFFKKI